jgi:hypothetical protein
MASETLNWVSHSSEHFLLPVDVSTPQSLTQMRSAIFDWAASDLISPLINEWPEYRLNRRNGAVIAMCGVFELFSGN